MDVRHAPEEVAGRDRAPARRRSLCARSSAAWSPSTTSTSRSRRARSSASSARTAPGKTTFFNMITGVYKPTAGRVVFDGEDIAGKPPHALTERGIGRTFQNIRLFQQMTPLENVLVGMHCRLKGGILGEHPRHARGSGARSVRRASARASCSRTAASRAVDDDVRAQPLVRRPAAARGRARARDAAEAPPPRRADRRDEPAGDGWSSSASSASCATSEELTILLIEHDMKVVMGVSDRVTVLDYGAEDRRGRRRRRSRRTRA